jgi:hypothetical protein
MAKNDNSLATKNDIFKIVEDATDKVLKGMDRMFQEQDKRNDTKFTTKEDLNREIGWVRDDIKGLETDLSDIPTKIEFNQLKARVDKHISAN